MRETCDRDCDLEDQPVVYTNTKQGWKRVKCDTCPFDENNGNH